MKSLYAAYNQAFADLQEAKQDKPGPKDKKTKVAGFEDFADFAGSEIGAFLLQTAFVPLISDEEDGENFIEKIAEKENSPAQLEDSLKKALENLLVEFSGSFTPLTAYFFQQAVILRRPLFIGDGVLEKGVLNDAELHKMAAADKGYAKLAADKLADKLIQKTATLIKKHSHPESPTDWMDEL